MDQLVPHHPAIIGAVIGALVAAALFVIRDVIWQRHAETRRGDRERWQSQLADLYAPLYRLYRDGFAQFDTWKVEHPESTLTRRPFVEGDELSAILAILKGNEALASVELLNAWASFAAIESPADRQEARTILVRTILRDYQRLRKSLGVGHNRREMRSGSFSAIEYGQRVARRRKDK